ncbi:hybrid sensor histidine kinase/response regulator [Halorientalis regularis]|uniref:histidine kinase n=1 Tax=Halorientalis regularis TaxID=660518 RepID=A0A1G7R8S1_9EURY|nr:PAS domain S-box-containing protein [Halorientalis regularis]
MPVPIRVLLTCSETDFAETVATALEGQNDRFAVTIAPTSGEGMGQLRTSRFDCVVSAYHLAETDGIEFLEAVRERYQDLPFVLYPSSGSEDVAAAAVSADATDYVQRGEDTEQHTVLARAIEDAVADASTTIGPDGLESILKTLPGCVVRLDDDGRFTYANPRAKEVLGLEQSEVTGRAYNDPDWEIKDLDGDPIPDEELPFRQVWDSGEPIYDYRHSIQWPDGSEKVLSVSGAPLFDGQGAVESVVFSLTDITERKRRERELERYQQIVEHLDDIATIIAPDGTIKYVSPAVERVLGYEPQELIGENGFGYQPPETSGAVADAIERVLSDPTEPQTIRTKFRRADGSWCWIESTLANRLDNDAINGILVSSRQVTEQQERKQQIKRRGQQLSTLHRATRELLDSETTQQVATTASQTAVDVLDFQLNGIHFYDEAANGLAPAAVSDASQELFDEVPVIDEGIAWQSFQSGKAKIHNNIDEADEVYNTETPVRSEMHLPLADHGVFIISSTETNAFEETDIEFARLLAANTEAALERISKQQQLQIRETELEQQNERLEEFASIVSHDLRNPLNVAQARTEALVQETDSEHLPPIEQALDRMENIISDTLTLARQGSVVAETERIQLAELVRECWQTVSTDEARIEVADAVTIVGDRSRLRHVFENLFRNTMEHGGTGLTVRVGRTADDGIYVEDTGPGIPEAERDVVFEPGHTSASDGTGFGLTIVKRIAEAHGWEVAVVDGADGGARFEFIGVEIDDG